MGCQNGILTRSLQWAAAFILAGVRPGLQGARVGVQSTLLRRYGLGTIWSSVPRKWSDGIAIMPVAFDSRTTCGSTDHMNGTILR